MTEKNKKERRQAMSSFIFIFSFTLLLFVLFAICTLKTAERGISLLDEKKVRYDDIFRKQAGYNYRMDEIFKDMNNLYTQKRTDNEQAQYQMIIAGKGCKTRFDRLMLTPPAMSFITYCSISYSRRKMFLQPSSTRSATLTTSWSRYKGHKI